MKMLRSILALCFLCLVATQGDVLGRDRDAKALRRSTPVGGLPTTEKPSAHQVYQPNPVAPLPGGDKSTNALDIHGTFSVEKFQGTQKDLNNTHESANGFRDYLANWWAPNFVYRDQGVAAWAFHDVAGGDNWDLWSNGGIDYGIDSVLVTYCSSHGGCFNNLYTFSLGANWAGRGWDARSDRMALGGNAGSFGNERLRYIFFDTCQSVKYRGGITPMTTWAPRANGVRMIFGYDDNAADSPNYGKYFWEEWNKGKTLSQSFLDASWRISHGQSPCVVAFGSTSQEAVNRRDNERFLEWGAVRSWWGAWKWYSANKSKGGDQDLNAYSVPFAVELHHAAVAGNTDKDVLKRAASVGIELPDDRTIQERPFGLRVVETEGETLIVEPDGDFEITLKATKRSRGLSEVPDEELVDRALDIVDEFKFAGDQEVRVDSIRYLNVAKGAADQKARPREVVEKTVVVDQVLGGLTFVDPDVGHIELTFDARSGDLRRVRSTFRRLSSPAEKQVEVKRSRSLAELRKLALEEFASPAAPREDGSAEPSRLQIGAGTEKLGYAMIDGRATPVFRAEIFDPRYPGSKRFEVTIPVAAE